MSTTNFDVTSFDHTRTLPDSEISKEEITPKTPDTFPPTKSNVNLKSTLTSLQQSEKAKGRSFSPLQSFKDLVGWNKKTSEKSQTENLVEKEEPKKKDSGFGKKVASEGVSLIKLKQQKAEREKQIKERQSLANGKKENSTADSEPISGVSLFNSTRHKRKSSIVYKSNVENSTNEEDPTKESKSKPLPLGMGQKMQSDSFSLKKVKERRQTLAVQTRTTPIKKATPEEISFGQACNYLIEYLSKTNDYSGLYRTPQADSVFKFVSQPKFSTWLKGICSDATLHKMIADEAAKYKKISEEKTGIDRSSKCAIGENIFECFMARLLENHPMPDDIVAYLFLVFQNTQEFFPNKDTDSRVLSAILGRIFCVEMCTHIMSANGASLNNSFYLMKAVNSVTEYLGQLDQDETYGKLLKAFLQYLSIRKEEIDLPYPRAIEVFKKYMSEQTDLKALFCSENKSLIQFLSFIPKHHEKWLKSICSDKEVHQSIDSLIITYKEMGEKTELELVKKKIGETLFTTLMSRLLKEPLSPEVARYFQLMFKETRGKFPKENVDALVLTAIFYRIFCSALAFERRNGHEDMDAIEVFRCLPFYMNLQNEKGQVLYKDFLDHFTFVLELNVKETK